MSEQQTQHTMKVGTGMRRITPPIGVDMEGFSSRNHGCEGIRDDLYVRCLWLENDDGARLVIVALDLCVLSYSTIEAWKQEMEKRWGLSAHEILINTTHTHSGPLTVHRFYERASLHEAYMATLFQRVMEAIDEASYTEDQCTLHTGQRELPIGVCRRYPVAEGVQWAPYPGGYVERNLSVLAALDRHGQPLCVLFSVAAHPSILADYWITADYPGMACRFVTEALGGRAMAMFLQGAAGDVKANVNADVHHGRWLKGTYADVKRTGRLVADAVLHIMAEEMHAAEPVLASAAAQADLPVGLPQDPAMYEEFYQRYPRVKGVPVDTWAAYWLSRYQKDGCLPYTVPCSVQVVRIGGSFNLVAVGAELTSGLAQVLRQALPEALNPIFLGYSNGVFGYLPSERMVQEGGYESMYALVYATYMPAPFGPGMESTLIGTVEQLLAAIAL